MPVAELNSPSVNRWRQIRTSTQNPDQSFGRVFFVFVVCPGGTSRLRFVLVFVCAGIGACWNQKYEQDAQASGYSSLIQTETPVVRNLSLALRAGIGA